MLRTALLVAGKDLRQRLRDRSALVIAFVAPFVLASIIGLAFGGDTAFKVTYAVPTPTAARWFQGLKTAGDLGAGWRPDQWGEVLAGGDPDGYRFSDGDRLEPGAGSP